jgi:hypothetical protein
MLIIWNYAPASLILILALTWIAPIQAADYFVHPQGSDTASGTISNPFQTINHALGLSKPYDSIYCREGVYREALEIQQGRSEGSYRVLRSYPGEVATLIPRFDETTWKQEDWMNIYSLVIEPNQTYFLDDNLYITISASYTEINGFHIKYGYQGVAIKNNITPVFDQIDTQTVAENSEITFTISASDENSDPLTYSVLNLPVGASLVDQNFSWMPNFEAAGEHPITFVASDGHREATMTVLVVVENVNRTPVFQPVGDIFVDDTQQIHQDLPASDPDGDVLNFSVLGNLPSGATIIGGTFHWTLQHSDSGTCPITFVASDGDLEATINTTLYVNHINQPPIIDVLTDQFINQYSTLTFPVTVSDLENDPVEVTIENLPTGAMYANDMVNWTPGEGQEGATQIMIEASDGQQISREAVTFFVIAASLDTTPPLVSYSSPTNQSIQTPLNSLLVMEVTDSGSGIDANTVVIQANGEDICRGNVAAYNSTLGTTHRYGNKALYKFAFQAAQMYQNDQKIDVSLDAKDLEGNIMATYALSFSTEMITFGGIVPVNNPSDGQVQSHPVTTRDDLGNLWVAWRSGSSGSGQIVMARILAGSTSFENSQSLPAIGDQSHPAIAVDRDTTAYLCWQEQREGIWNIYTSQSSDGLIWSTPSPVAGSDEDQTNPVMVTNSSTPGSVYIAYQQETASVQDIHLVASNNGFTSVNLTAITNHSSQQINPDIAVADGIVYVVWTDLRHPTTSIYGASSASDWINTTLVNQPSNHSQPSLTSGDSGQSLHLVWTDDQPGHSDIFYAKLSNGFSDAPLIGVTVIDDTTGRQQTLSRVSATGSGSEVRVFVVWQDERNSPDESDIYFVDLSAASRTNILVTTDTSMSSQTSPMLGVNGRNDPYLIWVEDRGVEEAIYYGGATDVAGEQIAMGTITQQAGGVVGTPLGSINDVGDISVEIPANALWSDVYLSITQVDNPIQAFDASTTLTAYEFSPSSEMEFARPVTITIPFETTEIVKATDIALYNPRIGQYSQAELSNIQVIKISPTLSALRFDTTHFFVVQFHIQFGTTTSAW